MSIQNHMKGAANALRELYAEEIREGIWVNPLQGSLENYLCSEDGKPIYLR